ncbi:MAG: hypothetical protein ACFFCO_09125 [Promethearchaeota archaeon]
MVLQLSSGRDFSAFLNIVGSVRFRCFPFFAEDSVPVTDTHITSRGRGGLVGHPLGEEGRATLVRGIRSQRTKPIGTMNGQSIHCLVHRSQGSGGASAVTDA